MALADGSYISILPNPIFHYGINLKERAAQPRALLRWFQSGRNRLGRMKKVWLFSNWHGGVMVKAVVYEAQGEKMDSQLGQDHF